ncbi:hypothetical protein B0H14DRAFT_3622186 [Mycena olivaceomarginata]|nr:hypothetical protein B0H14DRAFT_3622186 [Mycena olivaceomarginata]
MRLCEDFIAFLRILQTGLEKVIRNQVGFGGRFKEFLRATTLADQIVRYRNRINELRSNFLLVATIDTNLSVTRIQKSVDASEEERPIAHIDQFRRVAVGEINLLYETAVSSKVYKVKVFAARISGDSALMTVAKYEDESEESPDLPSMYIFLKFGIEMEIRLGTLFALEDTSQHHYLLAHGKEEKQGLQATICVKTNPVQLCLTMPPPENDSEDWDDDELSSWHTRVKYSEKTVTGCNTFEYIGQAFRLEEFLCVTDSYPVLGVLDKLWCAVMVDVECHHMLREDGTLQEAHIFVQPISVKHEGPHIGLDFPESDQAYWSLDPTGKTRMTQDECDSIGLPRLEFMFLPTARFWHEYQHDAIREFFEAKGFDPFSHDVTRLLGLPLAEMECSPPIPI